LAGGIEEVVVYDNRSAVPLPVDIPVTLSLVSMLPRGGASLADGTSAHTVRVRLHEQSSVDAVVRLDNGSDLNVIPKRMLDQLFPHARRVPTSNTCFVSVGGLGRAVGAVELLVQYGSRRVLDTFNVVETEVPLLIGNRTWPALGFAVAGVFDTAASRRKGASVQLDQRQMIDPNAPPIADVPSHVAKLLEENGAIPRGSACSHPMATVRVDMPPGTLPIYIPPRRVDQCKHQAVDDQVHEWLRDRIIEECPLASPWNCALVVVSKKDSDGHITGTRVCIDPRHLNALSPDDPHPLPFIIDYLDEACGAAVFSSLDLRGSFHQFSVHPEHRERLAFTWKGVQYRFRRGPFGLKALAGQFQRVMASIFADMAFVRVYIDDVVVFSASVKEHEVHLAVVIARLNVYNLALKPEKCRLFRAAIAYLGHVISASGISPAPSKVVEIQELERPTSGKMVQSLLGVINYLRHFVPCFASLAAPLDALRLKRAIDLGDPKTWTQECEDAFSALKKAVAASPILCKPVWNAPFFVATDASATGLGAVLFQGSREEPHYIFCASRSLSPSERRYSATKRELLGVIFALRKLRFYLAGRPFVLYTDHQALTHMFTQRHLNDMLCRWFDEIMEFDFKVEHLPGVLNVLPDCLSRLYPAGSAETFRSW
jgi:hypothetical protein